MFLLLRLFLLEQVLEEVDVAAGAAEETTELSAATAVAVDAAELVATTEELVAASAEDEATLEAATLVAAAEPVVVEPDDELEDVEPSEDTVTSSEAVPMGSVRNLGDDQPGLEEYSLL